jgi:hypothetical protein
MVGPTNDEPVKWPTIDKFSLCFKRSLPAQKSMDVSGIRKDLPIIGARAILDGIVDIRVTTGACDDVTITPQSSTASTC